MGENPTKDMDDKERRNYTFCIVIIAIAIMPKVAMQLIDEVSLEMHLLGKLPCGHVSASSRLYTVSAIRWTKITNVTVNPSVVTWNEGVKRADSEYDLDSKFSLLIKVVSVRSEGTFRCTAFYKNNTDKTAHDIRVSVYKHPVDAPFIDYRALQNKVFFTCSMGPLYPLQYPEFAVAHRDNDYMHNMHQDGSYTVITSTAIPLTEIETPVSCSYSYGALKWKTYLSDTSIGIKSTSHVPSTGNDTSTIFIEFGTKSNVIIACLVILLMIAVTTTSFLCISRMKNRRPDKPACSELESSQAMPLRQAESNLVSENTCMIHIVKVSGNKTTFQICPARSRDSCKCTSVSETEVHSNIEVASWLLTKSANLTV